jgi:hypothetical protein
MCIVGYQTIVSLGTDDPLKPGSTEEPGVFIILNATVVTPSLDQIRLGACNNQPIHFRDYIYRYRD